MVRAGSFFKGAPYPTLTGEPLAYPCKSVKFAHAVLAWSVLDRSCLTATLTAASYKYYSEDASFGVLSKFNALVPGSALNVVSEPSCHLPGLAARCVTLA